VILVGAEMNAEIEHASPYGKEEGEKVAGQKRKIGPARMRAWLARQRRGGKPPSAEEVRDVVDNSPDSGRQNRPGQDASPAPANNHETASPPRISRPSTARESTAGDFSGYVIGAGVVMAQMLLTLQSLKRRRT